MLVQDVMTPVPVTVTGGTTTKEALSLLARLGITSLPVVDERGRLCGIVSEADLIRGSVARDPRATERPLVTQPAAPPHTVDDVCTRDAVTAGPHDDVARVVDVLTSTGVKSVPVVDDDHRLVGILSRSDVVKVLARPDDVIAGDVDELLGFMGRGSWVVDVVDGVVEVRGPEGPAERSLAQAAARTVPGVVDVRVS